MATIIQGDDDTFNVLTSGVPHPSTLQFLEQERHQPTHLFAQYSQAFVDRTQEMIQWIENSQAARMALAAQRAMGHLWSNQHVHYLSTIGDFQWAPQTMVRWLMVEPSVRERYHQQRCEGYQGLYNDPFPEVPTEEHLDYRHVINGVVIMNESDQGPEWTATTYYDEREDVLPLDFLEQVDIIHSWETIRYWMQKGGDDPTSRFNSSL